MLKQFKSSNFDFYPTQSVNGSYLSDKFVTKFTDEKVVKKPRDMPGTNINQNLNLEPQDNKRGSSKKYYYDSRIKNNININNSYNKPNTIIINNNIHINTFIDKNNIRINQNNSNKSKTSKNLSILNEKNEKIINKMNNNESSFDEKYIENKNKTKNISEIKSVHKKINKSSIILPNKIDN